MGLTVLAIKNLNADYITEHSSAHQVAVERIMLEAEFDRTMFCIFGKGHNGPYWNCPG